MKETMFSVLKKKKKNDLKLKFKINYSIPASLFKCNYTCLGYKCILTASKDVAVKATIRTKTKL